MSVSVEEQSGGIPGYLSEAFRELGNRALDLSNQEYEPYRGQRFENFPNEIQQYLRIIGEPAPVPFDKSLHHARSGLKHLPEEYDRYLAPYRAQVSDKLQEANERNAREVLAQLEKTFKGVPGSRHAGLGREAWAEAQEMGRRRKEESLGRGHQSVVSGFGFDKARELEAAGILNKLGLIGQGARLQDAQALRETGLLRYENEQRRRDLAYEQWKEERRHPHESLAEYFNILRGVPYVSSTYQKNEETIPRQGMHRGDWGDIGLSLMSRVLARRGDREGEPSGSGRRLSILPEGFLERAAASSGIPDLSRGETRRERRRGGNSSSSSSSSSSRGGVERKQREEKRESERRQTRHIPAVPERLRPLPAAPADSNREAYARLRKAGYISASYNPSHNYATVYDEFNRRDFGQITPSALQRVFSSTSYNPSNNYLQFVER